MNVLVAKVDQAMHIRPSNIAFLVPAILIGPLLLAALMVHGFTLEQFHRFKRWRARRKERPPAEVIRLNPFLRPPHGI